MKRGFRDRLARIETEARKLARSGSDRGFSSIETVLLTQGYPAAPKVIAGRNPSRIAFARGHNLPMELVRTTADNRAGSWKREPESNQQVIAGRHQDFA
jgi:hypothetical protein